MLPARIPARVGLLTAVAFGATAFVSPAEAHSAPVQHVPQAAGCSWLSLLCVPVNLSVAVAPINLGSLPLTLDVGGIQVNLETTIDLASIEDAGSALAVVNSVDAGLDVEAQGVALEAFGVGAYAVDDFRVSAGAVYNQDALLGPQPYVADVAHLSAQSDLSRAAGVNIGDDLAVDAIDYAYVNAEAANASETTLLGDDGLATTSADTLRLSGDAGLYDLAHLGAGDTDTYLVDAARLSAQAGNDLLADLASDDGLVHVADSTRLSSQAVVDTVASTYNQETDEYDELIGGLLLDAEARNDLLAEVAAGPESSTQVIDAIDADVLAATPAATPIDVQVNALLALLFGGFGS